MTKRVRPEFEYHYLRHKMDGGERRQAIRKGYEDYQHHRWAKDPPYPNGDPRRWLWQDGAEMAERAQRDSRACPEHVDGWRD